MKSERSKNLFIEKNLQKLSKNLRSKVHSNLLTLKERSKSRQNGINLFLETQEEDFIVLKRKKLQEAKEREKNKTDEFPIMAKEPTNILLQDTFPIISDQGDTEAFLDKYKQIFSINSSNLSKLGGLEVKFQDLISQYREKGFNIGDLNKIQNIFNQSLLLIEDDQIDKYCQDSKIDKSKKEFRFLNNLYKLTFNQMNKGFNQANNAISKDNETFQSECENNQDVKSLMQITKNMEGEIQRLKDYMKSSDKEENKNNQLCRTINIESPRKNKVIKSRNAGDAKTKSSKKLPPIVLNKNTLKLNINQLEDISSDQSTLINNLNKRRRSKFFLIKKNTFKNYPGNENISTIADSFTKYAEMSNLTNMNSTKANTQTMISYPKTNLNTIATEDSFNIAALVPHEPIDTKLNIIDQDLVSSTINPANSKKFEKSKQQMIESIYQAIKSKDHNKNVRQLLLDYNANFINNQQLNQLLQNLSSTDILNNIEDTNKIMKKYNISRTFKEVVDSKTKQQIENIKKMERTMEGCNFEYIVMLNK